MAEEITSLKLKIDVQSVDEANKKLDDFSKKAEGAASATDEFENSQQIIKSSLSRTAKEVDEVHRRIAEYRKSLTANTNSAKKFAESSDRLYVGFRNQIDSLKDVNTASKELARVRKMLAKTYKDGQIDIHNYSQLLSDIAIKQKEVTTAENIATKAKIDFLNKLKSQVATQNLSKEQLLRYQAAQLGVSSSADVYIRKLTQATKETQKLGTASLATKHQLATMTTQMMRGNFTGLQTSIMKNGIGNTFSTLLTSLNPVNIGISAMVELLGSMIPKLFETESATDKLAAAQDRLNRVLNTDKNTGFTFLSDDMMQLLKKNRPLVEGLLKSSERDVKKTISGIKAQLQDGFKDAEVGWKETLKRLGRSGTSDLDAVLDSIQRLTKGGQDLSAALKNVNDEALESASGIRSKVSSYAEYFDITEEQAQDLLVDLSNIKAETDSIKASEKINDLINKLGNLYKTSDNGNDKFQGLINGLIEIANKASDASLKLQLLKAISGNADKATDPKKSPFYRYRLMSMNREQRIKAEIAEMEADAKRSNEINPGSVTEKDIADAAAAIRARNAEKTSSATNLLRTSQQQEISLKSQLQALREQSLTVNTITSERKKYFDLQAQIQTLESTGNKSRMSAHEKYVLAHKDALLAQFAKNAAISEEITQYETATKALRKMQEYTTNLSAKSKASQATFGMTSKNANRYNEMSELDAQRDIALKGTSNPTEITKITEEYNKAKQALQQSWQQEDINQTDWFAGLKVGINEFSDASRNMFDAFRDLGQQTMSSVSHSLTEFVTTGKMSFKSLAKSILTNIIEIINKLLVAQTIQSAMGWFGMASAGAGAATGGLQQAYNGGLIRGYATGGDVRYSINSCGFTGRGNKYEPAGIVHKGEFVFTKEATKRLGVGNLYALMNDAQRGYANGGAVNLGHASPIAFTRKSNKSSSAINVNTNVTLNMESNSESGAANSSIDANSIESQAAAIIDRRVNETIKKLVSPGGDLYNLMRAR
ncbi:phage tail tape measure protein [Gilliamella sp. Pra-s65]|uniref:phage tail tape measure protein n=1 Tax=unclassified Gilliamella TaxID=2685620 RepID=UPI0013652862|nr:MULTISPECIES: phage tail tape measure protein [unclassified Gilliamella]MWN91339.1 phage tail tape measure protein [Gilliamella sp. Pra-s65]MWP74306.1 phage tail tape measure protein [Gilliamella sp. Pra-s52]